MLTCLKCSSSVFVLNVVFMTLRLPRGIMLEVHYTCGVDPLAC